MASLNFLCRLLPIIRGCPVIAIGGGLTINVGGRPIIIVVIGVDETAEAVFLRQPSPPLLRFENIVKWDGLLLVLLRPSHSGMAPREATLLNCEPVFKRAIDEPVHRIFVCQGWSVT